MTNPDGPPDAPYGSPQPAGSQPTQPFWLGPGPGAPGDAGPGPAASQAAGSGEHLKRDRRTALHWTLGLAGAALLAGAGILAGLSLAGHPFPAAGQSQAGPAGTRQGALLNSALSRARSPGAAGALCVRARGVAWAAGQAGLPRRADPIAPGGARCRFFRHRVFTFFLLRGVDGQFTVQTGQGVKTLAYERGVIQTVNAGKSFVVEATSTVTWTWDLVSTTVVRDRQGKVSPGGLAAGTPVWVGGPVVQGAKDARLIVVRPPLPAAAPSSPTPG